MRVSSAEASAAGEVPELAVIERPRTEKYKKPFSSEGEAFKKFRGAGKVVTSVESSISISKRIADNPNNSLKISCGKLFCAACKEAIRNISSRINSHLGSKMHETKLKKFNSITRDDQAMTENLVTSPT